MAKNKKCENCETLNEQDSKFCEKCGNSLNSEPRYDMVNKVNCPFCGKKMPITAGKCNHCGEWVDPSKDKSHEVEIALGYLVSILFGWLGLIPAIYLLTCDSPRAKKHGKITLVVSLLLGLLMTPMWITFLLLL